MLNIPHLLCGIGSDGHQNYLYGIHDNVESYLARTNMAVDGTWGTDTEMCVYNLTLVCTALLYESEWVLYPAFGSPPTHPTPSHLPTPYRLNL